jgi:PAS domain S-box-containing protein
MKHAHILVVEDEPIVAKDIQHSLQQLGYRVPATVASGEDALRKAVDAKPDLVLMDIVLKGSMDGVQTAQWIQRRMDVPVVYLTAFADEETLERVKTTSPAGYVLKPYQPTELRTTVELALHRAESDRHFKETIRWFATTVRCMGDAIISTDRGGRVTYMNPAAERVTGWTQEESKGRDLTTLIVFAEEGPFQTVENPVAKAMYESRLIRLGCMQLRVREGMCKTIEGTIAPVINDAGTAIGTVVVFREAAGEEPSDSHAPPPSHPETFQADPRLGRAAGIINLCAWCKRVPDASGQWYDLETFISEHSSLQFNGGLCPDCMKRWFTQG